MTRTRTAAVYAGLAVVVVFAFWPVLSAGFTNYDDDDYVTRNPWVRQGLGAAGWSWAWTTVHAANYHPLTWLSHMLDCELFGTNARGHHAVGLLLHVANTLLLFRLLREATGAAGRSALVAALFGVHPLHVESVAWIAERKDVLSALFWLLASLAWVRHARSARALWRWSAVALLALGLAAKPMLVTLPFALLLLDRWPLGRWPQAVSPRTLWPLVREKLPMFLLVLASSVVTVLAQSAGGVLRTLEEVRLVVRLANVPVAYVAYLVKTLWPTDLAVLYPYRPGGPATWSVLASTALLVAVSWLALRQRSTRPYVLVGWFWFLGTLVPVIGLVQVGPQALADRYTYLPSIGLFVAGTWLVHDLLASAARRAGAFDMRRTAAGGAAVLVLGLALATRNQVRYWKDSVTLFTRALAVSGSHPLIHNNLGVALFDAGRVPEAIAQYHDALREGPSYEAHVNLGSALLLQGDPAGAVAQLERALALAPGHPDALNDLGLALAALGRNDEAIERYQAALARVPDSARTHANLGAALVAAGRPEEAVTHCREAVRLEPLGAENHLRLALAWSAAGRAAEAAESYERSLAIDPDQPRALNNLGALVIEGGGVDRALALFDRALALAPDYGEAHSNRAAALYFKGAYAEAWQEVLRAREDGFEPPERLVELLAGGRPG